MSRLGLYGKAGSGVPLAKRFQTMWNLSLLHTDEDVYNSRLMLHTTSPNRRNPTFPTLVALAVSTILLPAAKAQFTQQGNKLIGTGVAEYAGQGASVAVSADGNTAIVGGNADNFFAGAAWVFRRSGGLWAQEGSKLVGTGAVGNAFQGDVALSADGNTAIVGGFNDNGGAGAAWVFTRSGGVWTQQGNKLIGMGAAGPAGQGFSVALSSDGNTAIVGGPNDNGGTGAAWVFTRSNSVWTQQGDKLIGTGASGMAEQGYSVALSADGNTAIVGGDRDNGSTGAVWVFTRSGGVWIQQGNKLVGTGLLGVQQGSSVALSADANTAIVGGPNDPPTGATWVFTRSNGVWSQQGSKLVGTGATGRIVEQGNSVALSADGNAAIVGGPHDDNDRGAAWVFTRSNGVWTQQGGKLFGTGAIACPQQGVSVRLSADGNTAIVGGPGDDSTTGAAWVFVRPPAPHISAGGVVSGGLSLPSLRVLAPNAIATVFGDTFAPADTRRGVATADLVNGRLPTVLDGVCVFVNNIAAPLFFLAATQINFQVPQVSTGGTVGVQVATSCGTANEVRSSVESAVTASAAPEFFYFTHNPDGKNPIAALNAITGSYIGPPGLLPGANFVAASPGDILTLFFTGGGSTNPAFAAGELPGSSGDVTGTVGVTLAGTQLSAGFAGLYQLNIRGPAGTLSGNQAVILTINNAPSPTGYLFIGP